MSISQEKLLARKTDWTDFIHDPLARQNCTINQIYEKILDTKVE